MLKLSDVINRDETKLPPPPLRRQCIDTGKTHLSGSRRDLMRFYIAPRFISSFVQSPGALISLAGVNVANTNGK